MSKKINMAEVITDMPDFLNENTDLMLEKLWEATTLGSGIERIVDRQSAPVTVVPMALCNLWGSLFSRRDPLHKRRPYKFRALIELRIGEPIPSEELTAERLEKEVRLLRGEDR